MYYYQKSGDEDGFYNTPDHQIRGAINHGGVNGVGGGQVASEYVYEENGMSQLFSTKPHIKDGGYLLPKQDANNAPDILQSTISPQNKKKSTVSDIYDEDHYTLARNSGFDFDANDDMNHAETNGSTKNGLLFSKNLVIIGIVCGIFAMGGVCIYLDIQSKGTIG